MTDVLHIIKYPLMLGYIGWCNWTSEMPRQKVGRLENNSPWASSSWAHADWDPSPPLSLLLPNKMMLAKEGIGCRLSSVPMVVIVLSSPIFSSLFVEIRQRSCVTQEFAHLWGIGLRLDSSYDTRCFYISPTPRCKILSTFYLRTTAAAITLTYLQYLPKNS